MRATVVATPVLERLRAGAAAGVVRGATERAAYLDFDGFVVALTAPGVPLMPNGVAVARTAVRDGAVRATPGRIVVGGEAVTWSAEAVWEPRLPPVGAGRVQALRERGAAIRAALGGEPSFDAELQRALRERNADLAALAAGRLIGLGGGLTPEGDDVLAATAAVVVAVADAVGLEGANRFVAALVPADAGARTTALSATLLALAAEGRIVEPVHRLLDLDGGEAAWREALAALVATGASTGRAYGGAVAATLEALASRSGAS
jgi:Protein of unknown function (DUF2877)